jgi:K+-sensing histidine kinase KdpD
MENVLVKINKTALSFLSPLTTEQTLVVIVNEARKLVDAEYGSIFLENDNKLKRVYASFELLYDIKPLREGFVYKSFRTHKPYVVNIKRLEKLYPKLKEIGVKSDVVIPLSYKGDCIGVLTLQSLRSEHFSKKELEILTLFGAMATLAIKKNQLYEETKNSLEIRDLFISLASHELRTPLTSLNGYIQLLYQKLKDKHTPEANWVKELYAESTRLTNLVKELLEINRIKTGELQYNLIECNMNETVKKAIARFSFSNPERKIKYQSSVSKRDDVIIGDCDKLLQMLAALISNAVKFSPPHTPITIFIRQNKTHIFIQIIDEGSGIKRQDLGRIFEGFYKGAHSEKEGMGVGLLLARHIIQYHHGAIEVRSKENKGTTVEVKLPKIKIED